mgnify:CR=1 FL=1
MQSALRACDKIETSIVAIVSTNAGTRTFLKIGFLCCDGSHACLAGMVRHSDASVDMRGHMRQMSRAIPAETLVEDLRLIMLRLLSVVCQRFRQCYCQ